MGFRLRYILLTLLSFAANSGLHIFEFLANSILKEVHSAIIKGKPGACSPGKPKEFLKNYKASLRFLDFLEGILNYVMEWFVFCH
jgi:hypothetical protein